MPFVRRDANKKIVAVFGEDDGNSLEKISPGDPELREFLTDGESENSEDVIRHLIESDAGMVRVLDDLINLMIEKGFIRITDFPEAAQQKLLERGSLRNQFGFLGALYEDGQDPEEEVFAPDAKDFL